MPESNDRGALTEAVYYILLSLIEPMHGYGVMQYVKDISHDRVNLGPGTLYGALNTLVEKKWIKTLPSEDNDRKKQYQITPLGRSVVQSELERLKELHNTGLNILGGTPHDH